MQIKFSSDYIKQLPPVRKYNKVFSGENRSLNLFYIGTFLYSKYIYIQNKFDEICELHRQINLYMTDNKDVPNTIQFNQYDLMEQDSEMSKYFETGAFDKYFFITEELISHIRQSIDLLIQIAYIYVAKNDHKLNIDEIECDSIGKVKYYKKIKDIIYGSSVFLKDKNGFLDMLNSISNSIKHCASHHEGQTFWNKLAPNFSTIYFNNNNFSDCVKSGRYSVYLHDIMVDYQSNFERIIINIDKYIEANEIIL